MSMITMVQRPPRSPRDLFRSSHPCILARGRQGQWARPCTSYGSACPGFLDSSQQLLLLQQPSLSEFLPCVQTRVHEQPAARILQACLCPMSHAMCKQAAWSRCRPPPRLGTNTHAQLF